MENFSTPRLARLPWVANLATVAVVVAAISWSNDHRPAAPANEAALSGPASNDLMPTRLPALDLPISSKNQASPSTNQPMQAGWPSQTTSVAVEGLQVVGFIPSNRR